MVYLIIGILLLLLYIFATPQSIKGTVNVVIPAEIFITMGMLALTYFSLRDISLMSIRKKREN